MKDLMLCLAFVAVAIFGNWTGDQSTIRQCATYGKAPMLGGGTVICHVETNVVPTSGETK